MARLPEMLCNVIVMYINEEQMPYHESIFASHDSFCMVMVISDSIFLMILALN